MIKGSLAKRYARALMAIGQDKGIYEQLGAELIEVAALSARDESFRLVISAPIVTKEVREQVVVKVAEAMKLHEVTVRFLRLLSQKGRLGNLEAISQAYAEMVDEAKGRLRADVISASPLSAAAEAKLKETLKQMTGKDIIMSVQVDDSLIGGVVTRVAGKLLDGSVKTQLKAMEQSLKSVGA